MKTQAIRIVQAANLFLNFSEEPAGSNKTLFGQWSGFDGQPWCGSFASFVLTLAGINLPAIDFKNGFVNCDNAAKFFQKNKSANWQIITQPKEGCLIFYDWEGNGNWDHVGIISAVNNSKFFFVTEGNTNKEGDNSAEFVWIKKRPTAPSKAKYLIIEFN